MENARKAAEERRWRYALQVASHLSDLSLDGVGTNHHGNPDDGEGAIAFWDRVAQVTMDRELAEHDLEALIQQTRQELVQVLQRQQEIKGPGRKRNMALCLAIFDGWCDGVTRTETGRDHGISRARASQIGRYLLSLDVMQRFAQRVRQQLEAG